MNTTVEHQYQLHLHHEKRQRKYENVGTMYKALKNQVIDSIKDRYLN